MNNKAHELFGFKDREEYMKSYASSFPEFQPDGNSSNDIALKFISNVIKDGSATLEWHQRTSNGGRKRAGPAALQVRKPP